MLERAAQEPANDAVTEVTDIQTSDEQPSPQKPKLSGILAVYEYDRANGVDRIRTPFTDR